MKSKISIDSKLLKKDAYLRKAVESIVRHYNPIEIYLFGSKARGDEGPNSDYDLLVIVDRKVAREHRSKFHELRRKAV
jgi:predicted nucleotidyltransferase